MYYYDCAINCCTFMLLIFNVVTLRFISNLAIIIFFESTQICY